MAVRRRVDRVGHFPQRQYDHKAYYTIEGMDQVDSPELMVPRAAILAASILNGPGHDRARARQYVASAMEQLDWTYQKRRTDWLKQQDPPPLDPAVQQLFDKHPEAFAKEVAARKAAAQGSAERRRAAAEGNVITSLEMSIVKAAVRQYGVTSGPLMPAEVPVVMGEIIRKFPDTPMAKVAAGHRSRAVKMVEAKELSSLPNDLLLPNTSAVTARTSAATVNSSTMDVAPPLAETAGAREGSAMIRSRRGAYVIGLTILLGGLWLIWKKSRRVRMSSQTIGGADSTQNRQ